MNSGECEVCGRPATVHSTELTAGSSMKREHHYCLEHIPAAVRSRFSNSPEQLAILTQKLNQIDLLPIDDAEKEVMRTQMKQLMEQMRAT